MLNAGQAKINSIADTSESYYWNTIKAKVYDSIGAGLLHCDYYTPVRYDCVESDSEIIKDIKEILEALGYKCRITIFEPNKNYKNTRIKLHISWE